MSLWSIWMHLSPHPAYHHHGKNIFNFVKIVSSVMFSCFLHAFHLLFTSAGIFILLSFHLSWNDKSVSNCYQFFTAWYKHFPLCNEISNTFKFDNTWWYPGSGTAHFGYPLLTFFLFNFLLSQLYIV